MIITLLKRQSLNYKKHIKIMNKTCLIKMIYILMNLLNETRMIENGSENNEKN